MAGFCQNCGAALSGGQFCTACGTPAAAAIQTSVQPLVSAYVPVSTPVTPYAPVVDGPSGTVPAGSAPGKSNLVKILFIILGIIALLLTLAMGTCIYVGYRIKQKATEFTHAAGSDVRYTGKKDACSLISASEVGAATGTPAKLADNSSSSDCRFILGDDDTHQLDVQFTWQGGAMLMKITHAAMTHVAAGMDTYTPVRGLGDEAYISPMGSGVMMRKGDVLVNIDLRTAGLDADAGKKIAATIAARL